MLGAGWVSGAVLRAGRASRTGLRRDAACHISCCCATKARKAHRPALAQQLACCRLDKCLKEASFWHSRFDRLGTKLGRAIAEPGISDPYGDVTLWRRLVSAAFPEVA